MNGECVSSVKGMALGSMTTAKLMTVGIATATAASASVSVSSAKAGGTSKAKVSAPAVMRKAKRSARVVTPGQRVGTKRRDMRWEAEGQTWDSRLEYEVYRVYRDAGYDIRRCTEQDSVRYTRPVRNGLCNGCGSNGVDSVHSYTADFFVSANPKAEGGQPSGPATPVATTGHYLEVKGYLRADRRSLLRALRKARPDVDLRLIAQRDYRVTKTATLTQWARKYLRCPSALWTGSVPDWNTYEHAIGRK